jgi:hypothetical protein
MNRIISPIRMRVLEWAIRTLGRAITASAQGLLAAGVSPTDINAMFRGSVPVEHTDTDTEHLLVLQTLEQPGARSRAELEGALSDIAPLAISDALTALEAEDVIVTGCEQVWASRCVRHLDQLGLIAL